MRTCFCPLFLSPALAQWRHSGRGAYPRIVDLNGTPTNYNGDMIIVLDQNMQVVWVWDSFQWLDTSRLPRSARARSTGCTPIPLTIHPKTAI